MRKNRRIKTITERYENYMSSTIYLKEDGVVYAFSLDKFIVRMEKELSKPTYKKKTTYDGKMQIFFDNLRTKLSSQGGDDNREAKWCGTPKSFARNFDPVIKDPSKSDDKAQKKCIHLIRDFEAYFDGAEFLSNPEESSYRKNVYIDSLIYPLINTMIKSDFFYYIPNSTKTLGYQCYWNQMRMIEKNIEILFKDEKTGSYELWQEILEPLRKIIGNGDDEDSYPGGDFPGFISNMKIWLDANPNLKYFDPVYDIAEMDYPLYEKIINGEYGKLHFNFEIGNTKDEVKEAIKKRYDFIAEKEILRNNFVNDVVVQNRAFFEELKKAYESIVKDKMDICCH